MWWLDWEYFHAKRRCHDLDCWPIPMDIAGSRMTAQAVVGMVQTRGEGLSRNQGTVSFALFALLIRFVQGLVDHARASLLPDPRRGIRPVS
jgi:hypothetical protein